MVRVLTCFNFTSHNIIKNEAKPSAIYSAEGLLVVASDDFSVSVYSLEEGSKPEVIAKFPSLCKMSHVEYSKYGDFILSLEHKSTLQRKLSFVRIYLNWRTVVSEAAVPVRLTGLSQSKNTISDYQQFHTLELPVKTYISAVSVCHSTGNVVAVSKCLIRVFILCFRIATYQDQGKYVDFEHLLDVSILSAVNEVALCESYLALASSNSLRVIKIEFSGDQNNVANITPGQVGASAVEHFIPPPRELNDPKTRRWSSPHCDLTRAVMAKRQSSDLNICDSETTSQCSDSVFLAGGVGGDFDVRSLTPMSCFDMITEPCNVKYDDTYFQWTFDEDKNTDRTATWVQRPLSNKRSASLMGLTTAQPYIDRSNEPMEVHGPVDSIPGLPIFIQWAGVYGVGIAIDGVAPTVSATTVLYKRVNMLVGDSLHSLGLLPVYNEAGRFSAEQAKGVSSRNNLLTDTDNRNLISLSCFITTCSTGFQYSLLGVVTLLTTYSYTNDCLGAGFGSNVLCAFSRNAIEVYTMRMAPVLCNKDFVSDLTSTMHDLVPVSDEVDVCLICFTPTDSIQLMSVNNDSVVFIKESQGSNLINVLKLMSANALCHAMISMAEMIQDISSTVYHHLVAEAYLILRTEIVKGTASSDKDIYVTKTATMLGHYYARCDGQDGGLSVPFYKLSGLSVCDIVKRHTTTMDIESECVKPGEGLIMYLDKVLFIDLGGIIHDCEEEPVVCCDKILDIYYEVAKHKLSDVLLFAKKLTYSPEKAVHLMKDMKLSSRFLALDAIAMAIMYLHIGEADGAQEVLMNHNDMELRTVFIAHLELLSKGVQLTPLGQLLRKHKPNLFLCNLISLLDGGQLTLEEVLLYIGVDENDKTTLVKNKHSLWILEIIMNNEKRSYLFEEAAPLLVDIYIHQLKQKPVVSLKASATGSHAHVFKGNGHFAPRWKWLNMLPPFNGSVAIGNCCRNVHGSPRQLTKKVKRAPTLLSSNRTSCHETCGCCCCNEDLMKLQSLLSSSYCNGNLADKVFDHLNSGCNIRGVLSLKMLAFSHLDPCDGVSDLLATHSKVVWPYTIDVFTERDQWDWLLNLLLSKLRRVHQGCEEYDECRHILHKCLSKLAGDLDTKEFLDILPADGDVTFFFPYIDSSLNKLRSKKLTRTISSI